MTRFIDKNFRSPRPRPISNIQFPIDLMVKSLNHDKKSSIFLILLKLFFYLHSTPKTRIFFAFLLFVQKSKKVASLQPGMNLTLWYITLDSNKVLMLKKKKLHVHHFEDERKKILCMLLPF